MDFTVTVQVEVPVTAADAASAESLAAWLIVSTLAEGGLDVDTASDRPRP